MAKSKVTLVDLTLVGTTYCPTGYGEVRFNTIVQAKRWLKDHGYKIDLNLTQQVESMMDVYTKRKTMLDLQKAYLERI